MDGKSAVEKVEKIPHSDTTVSRRCEKMAENLEDQLISKLNKSPSFSLQLDETTYISSDAQLIVFCKFADVEEDKIIEHYLFCSPVGVHTTGEAIFAKLDSYITQKKLIGRNVSQLQLTKLLLW